MLTSVDNDAEDIYAKSGNPSHSDMREGGLGLGQNSLSRCRKQLDKEWRFSHAQGQPSLHEVCPEHVRVRRLRGQQLPVIPARDSAGPWRKRDAGRFTIRNLALYLRAGRLEMPLLATAEQFPKVSEFRTSRPCLTFDPRIAMLHGRTVGSASHACHSRPISSRYAGEQQ